MKFFSTLLLFGLLLLAITPRQTSPTASAQVCHEVTLSGRINGGHAFARELGENLWLHLFPLGDNGWTIEIKRLHGDSDYAYPLNPPLRSANSQFLGTGYSITAKEQLSHEHAVYFVLNPSDYNKAMQLAQEALWPYYAAAPEKATEHFLAALPGFPSGLLTVKPLKYVTWNGGETVKWMRFSVTVVVPSSFHFTPGASSKETACPAREP
jgi:hypothetical protein